MRDTKHNAWREDGQICHIASFIQSRSIVTSGEQIIIIL